MLLRHLLEKDACPAETCTVAFAEVAQVLQHPYAHAHLTLVTTKGKMAQRSAHPPSPSISRARMTLGTPARHARALSILHAVWQDSGKAHVQVCARIPSGQHPCHDSGDALTKGAVQGLVAHG